MSLLVAVIVGATVASIVSAVILVHAAWKRPRIGALTERAVLAVLLSAFGVVYTAIALNAELGDPFLTLGESRIVLRIAVIALLLIPAWWTALYLTGRLDK